MKDEWWKYPALFFAISSLATLIFAYLRNRWDNKKEEKRQQNLQNGRLRRFDDPERRDPTPSPTRE